MLIDSINMLPTYRSVVVRKSFENPTLSNGKGQIKDISAPAHI
jgi:hypothetical protein